MGADDEGPSKKKQGRGQGRGRGQGQGRGRGRGRARGSERIPAGQAANPEDGDSPGPAEEPKQTEKQKQAKWGKARATLLEKVPRKKLK